MGLRFRLCRSPFRIGDHVTRSLQLLSAIQPQREALLLHPVYQSVRTLEDLQRFMEVHVFAVWDFMSLLKALQQRLTCTTLPWLPVGDPDVRAMINEIVLGEESDVLPDGTHRSHYELYHAAMTAAGANTMAIDSFLQDLRRGTPWVHALQSCPIPESVRDFVSFSVGVAEHGSTAEVAAVFAFGREDVIPDMFSRLVSDLERNYPDHLAAFRYYLDRHIELDGDEHGPLSLKMMDVVCGGDADAWIRAERAAQQALELRVRLWDAIVAQ